MFYVIDAFTNTLLQSFNYLSEAESFVKSKSRIDRETLVITRIIKSGYEYES